MSAGQVQSSLPTACIIVAEASGMKGAERIA
jgi:hypothetical protein